MSKVILFSIVSIVAIILFIQFRKQKVVKIPVDKINVEGLVKAFDDDLNAEISSETEGIIVEAIIDDLEEEATEALPETLTPSVENIELSEEDSQELQDLLSDEPVSLGGMLGMSLTPVKTLKKLTKPIVDQEEKKDINLDNIKNQIVKDESKKLTEQVKFIDTQVQNIENERSVKKDVTIRKIKEIESNELKKAKEQKNITKVEDIKEKVQKLQKKVEIEDIDLKEKSQKLAKISKEKKTLSDDKSKLVKRLKNVKHPRRSKKGKVKSKKVPKADGGVSFKLEVPSDINPEEIDEIDIEISEETSKTLEQFEDIKARISKDKSLDNISEDDKKVIKSAGKEFKKIKKSYVEKRSSRIRKRAAKKIKK